VICSQQWGGRTHPTNPQVHGTKWSSSPSGEETPQGFTAYRTPRPGGSPLSLVRNFGNDLGRSFEDCYLLLGFLGNPRHEEMFIESQSCLDAEPFHHCERGTICERIRFIRMLNEGNSSKTPATYLHASSNSVHQHGSVGRRGSPRSASQFQPTWRFAFSC